MSDVSIRVRDRREALRVVRVQRCNRSAGCGGKRLHHARQSARGIVSIEGVRRRMILVASRCDAPPGVVCVGDAGVVRIRRLRQTAETVVSVGSSFLLDPGVVLASENSLEILFSGRRIVCVFDSFAQIVRRRSARHRAGAPAIVIPINGRSATGPLIGLQRACSIVDAAADDIRTAQRIERLIATCNRRQCRGHDSPDAVYGGGLRDAVCVRDTLRIAEGVVVFVQRNVSCGITNRGEPAPRDWRHGGMDRIINKHRLVVGARQRAINAAPPSPRLRERGPFVRE